MKSYVFYAALFLILSVSLTSIFISNVEAKSFDKEQTYTIKGDGVRIFSTGLTLSILPNEDSNSYTVHYVVNTPAGKTYWGLCSHSTDNIVKISALKKALIKFNTDDLGDCITLGDPYVPFNVSLNIQTNGESTLIKYDNQKKCDQIGDILQCYKEHGTDEGKEGIAVGIVFENDVKDLPAKISKINQKFTFWTEP